MPKGDSTPGLAPTGPERSASPVPPLRRGGKLVVTAAYRQASAKGARYSSRHVDSPTSPVAAARKERLSVARNPKAAHDFFILDTLEAGLVLTGTEVKAIRTRGASIKESFARISRGEVWLEAMNITPYEQGNRYNHDPVRPRKLLLNRKEIEKLIGAVERQGLALVPSSSTSSMAAQRSSSPWAGKKAHDKRETLKKHEAEREMARAIA